VPEHGCHPHVIMLTVRTRGGGTHFTCAEQRAGASSVVLLSLGRVSRIRGSEVGVIGESCALPTPLLPPTLTST
jgi:hypothetical protein